MRLGQEVYGEKQRLATNLVNFESHPIEANQRGFSWICSMHKQALARKSQSNACQQSLSELSPKAHTCAGKTQSNLELSFIHIPIGQLSLCGIHAIGV